MNLIIMIMNSPLKKTKTLCYFSKMLYPHTSCKQNLQFFSHSGFIKYNNNNEK